MFANTSTNCYGHKIEPLRGMVILSLCDVFGDREIHDIVRDYMAEFEGGSRFLTGFFSTVEAALEWHNRNHEEDEQKRIPTKAEFNAAMIALGKKLRVNPNKVMLIRH